MKVVYILWNLALIVFGIVLVKGTMNFDFEQDFRQRSLKIFFLPLYTTMLLMLIIYLIMFQILRKRISQKEVISKLDFQIQFSYRKTISQLSIILVLNIGFYFTNLIWNILSTILNNYPEFQTGSVFWNNFLYFLHVPFIQMV